jgi:Mce-associated membrane protein
VADEVTRRPGRWPLRIALVALGLAVGFTGFAGWTYLHTRNDDRLAFASDRDSVLRTGRSQVAVLTTLDSHDVDGALNRWLSITTGPLHDQVAATSEATKTTLRSAGTVATGTILDAAVSELDQRAGTAKLLVSVEITTAKPGQPDAAKRNRFVVGLSRDQGDWKLSALDQVPLGAQ